MSKNIIMQQKTASGYEELYPKANGDGSVIVNNTTNQFLGGGSTVGDALEYLSKFGMYWWKKVYQKPNYSVNSKASTCPYYQLSSSIGYQAIGLVETHYPENVNDDRIETNAPFEVSNTLSVDEQGNLSLRTLRKATAEWAYQGDDNSSGTKYCWLTIANDKKGDSVFIKVGSSYYWVEARSKYELRSALTVDSNTYYLVSSGDAFNFYSDDRYGTVYIPASYISSYTTTTTYICSSDPNAYPDQGNTDSSGAKYWKVGQPWEFLPKLGKVETGYYTGTGSGNVTLTFENAPQFLFAQRKDGDGGKVSALLWCEDATYMVRIQSNMLYGAAITQSGNSLILNHSYLNDNAVAYLYFAITQ